MKTKLLATFLLGLGVGALPSRLLSDAPESPRLEFQTANVFRTRARLPDGGESDELAFRACGYVFAPDGGRLGEPCWVGKLKDASTAAPVVQEMLNQYNGGR